MNRVCFSCLTALLILGLSAPVGAVEAEAAPVPRQQPPSASASAASAAPAPQPPPAVDAPINAGQIQRWFEAFTVLQAQEALQLSEAQYGRFVTRLKALQETRRKHLQAHNQIVNDLRKLTNPQTGTNDETAIAERLKSLRDEDERAATDLRKAYDGVDESLDVRQQGRFRVFEERMEQQKLELLMRARLNARAAAARGRSEGK